MAEDAPVAQEGIPQPVGVLNEFMAVPAFDAQRAVIYGMFPVRRNAGDGVIFNVEVQPAAASAIRAGSGKFFHTRLIITL
jgi:hypothetical protein